MEIKILKLQLKLNTECLPYSCLLPPLCTAHCILPPFGMLLYPYLLPWQHTREHPTILKLVNNLGGT